MYGKGSILSAGTGSTVGGIAALPFTGGNPILTVLSVATATIGALILISFVVTRISLRGL